MFRNTLLGTMLLCLLFSGQVMAIGLPKLLSGKDSEKLKSAVQDRDKIAEGLYDSSQEYLEGLGSVAQAIGAKDEISSIQSYMADLKNGKSELENDEQGQEKDEDNEEAKGKATIDKFKDAMSYAKQAQELIQGKMQAADMLNDSSCKLLVQGVQQFAQGVVKQKDALEAISNLVAEANDLVQNASPLDKVKAVDLAGQAVSLSSQVPDNISFGISTLKTLKDFMDSKKIEVPGQVTELLAKLF